MKKVLTFDLDNTIFDTTPVFIEAFKRHNKEFYPSSDFNVRIAYPQDIAEEIIKLFSDDLWYNTSLLNDEVPYYINQLNDIYKIYYVSARNGKPESESQKQLLRNNIRCNLEQIIRVSGNKIEALKNLKTTLHFDDSPHVIEACLKENINCHMISNEMMVYNHYLRNKVKHSKNLKEAIEIEKLLEKTK